ncbi:L-aspartate oxidase [Brachybacterium vulturis]|uniref:L-aspartate oxidase n=1 Tax=Brachybacterium vulturis TaxID=2017484 RepID=A0A291GN88_9MICO|nr:L-aspartate oxidase [Brachybacterium vulturis]ATG51809.1 L-aspartate oxidase [Brachybacterium vulturis]
MTGREVRGAGAQVLVVGSGIAGLTAALRASRTAHVMLVTKGALGDGATACAQGGIAGAVGPGDTPAQHARDTSEAGAGLCAAEAVRVLCQEGPEAIDELIGHGVRFDREASTAGSGAGASPYALGLEGAHGRARILHAGGDATGRAIQEALVRAVAREACSVAGPGSLVVREHTTLVDLLLETGRVVGAELLGADGTRLVHRAAVAVLATGGAGQLFAHTTNPAVATGDGIAAAWRAGAELEDLEFFQFHPTALAGPGSFLISEAVRGEGATLRDERGQRFLPALDPRAELAPRDVVARAIARVMRAQAGRPVLLDATAIGGARLRRRFPSIDAELRARGIDWARAPVPVTPAAHYWMGGIRTALDGTTSLPGLLAAGECARTGVHGANRLASNSLLEGAVFGARAGDAAAAVARTGTRPVTAPHPGRVRAVSPSRTAGAGWTRGDLQQLMWRRAGLLRTGAELDEAADALASWQADDPAELSTVAALEDRNLLDLARLLVARARARPDSLGAHHRLDTPAIPVQEDHAC